MADKAVFELTKMTWVDGEYSKRRYRKSFSGLTEIHRDKIALAADATVTLWDGTSDLVTPFEYLFIRPTVEIDVELTAKQGDSNEELVTFRIPAGGWFLLMADDSYYNHSANNAFGGTLDVFDLIRVDEPNSTAGSVYYELGYTS